MQFLIVAYDEEDAEALERRMRVRERHLAMGDKMVRAGEVLFAAAILNDEQKMIGSMQVVNFPSRGALDDLRPEARKVRPINPARRPAVTGIRRPRQDTPCPIRTCAGGIAGPNAGPEPNSRVISGWTSRVASRSSAAASSRAAAS